MSEDGDDQGHGTGYSFLATVIAAGLLGYMIDKFFPTAPWGLLGFLVIGIIYATYKAQKAMNPDSTKKNDNKA